MSSRKVYHVVPFGSAWQVKKEKDGVLLSTCAKKEDAIARATEIAKKNEPSQIIIHKADGTFEKEYTYGNDPYPPKG